MTPATTNREARSGAQDRQAMTTQMISMMQETPPTCPWSQQADDAAALEGRNQSSAGPDYHDNDQHCAARSGGYMGRHERRADIARFRHEADHALLTFLVEPDDVRLSRTPLLQSTVSNWIDLLDQRVRHCIICSKWIVDRQSVGLLLLATPATVRPTSASACAVCCKCADADPSDDEDLQRRCARCHWIRGNAGRY